MKSLYQINFQTVTLLCIFTAMLCIVISENTGRDRSHMQVLQKAPQSTDDSGFKSL